MVNLALARWVRARCKRIRRREFSVSRKPQATRLTCLTSLLRPPVRALLRAMCRNARIARQVSIVVASRCSSGMLVST